MTAKNLKVGKKYIISTPEGASFKMYFVEQVEKYDHKCDCCNKNTMDGFVFSEEFFPEDYVKTWDSGTWFVGGTSCLRKYVSEICE